MFAVHQKYFSIHDVSFPLLTWSVDNLTVSESREEETMMLFNKKHTVIMDYIITIQSYVTSQCLDKYCIFMGDKFT